MINYAHMLGRAGSQFREYPKRRQKGDKNQLN
jgi:hypothetical protein